jgi:hypothetical protein
MADSATVSASGSLWERGGASDVLRTWWGGDTSPMTWLTQVNGAFTRVNVKKAKQILAKNRA